MTGKWSITALSTRAELRVVRFGASVVAVLFVLGAIHADGLEIWEIQGSGLRSPYES